MKINNSPQPHGIRACIRCSSTAPVGIIAQSDIHWLLLFGTPFTGSIAAVHKFKTLLRIFLTVSLQKNSREFSASNMDDCAKSYEQNYACFGWTEKKILSSLVYRTSWKQVLSAMNNLSSKLGCWKLNSYSEVVKGKHIYFETRFTSQSHTVYTSDKWLTFR